jgi:alkylated DNA repair protein (DNA oxidative demethylase)
VLRHLLRALFFAHTGRRNHAMTLPLFPDEWAKSGSDSASDSERETESLADGAMILRGLACSDQLLLWRELLHVISQAPLRRMLTPGGLPFSVDTTSCGQVGWISDRRGYRYVDRDPISGAAWPALPDSFLKLATVAAERAGFPSFVPDSCLINRYQSGSKMSLHQDRDERDVAAPIVSVSLGLSAVFLFGGLTKADKVHRVRLYHGDVVVFGGPSRLRFHGILPLTLRDENGHSLTGPYRINLTFRTAR